MNMSRMEDILNEVVISSINGDGREVTSIIIQYLKQLSLFEIDTDDVCLILPILKCCVHFDGILLLGVDCFDVGIC